MSEQLRQLEASVAAQIAAERGAGARLRAWPRAARLGLVALALTAIAALFWAFLRRPDHAIYPELRFVLLGGGYATMALVAAWHALRPLWLPPAPRWTLVATLVASLLVPLLAALLPELPTLPRYQPSLPHHAAWAFECWAIGGAAGLVVLLLARALDRGGHGGHDHALLAALAAAMVGLAALHIKCPLNFTAHLLLVHATLPLLFLGAARWLWRARV